MPPSWLRHHRIVAGVVACIVALWPASCRRGWIDPPGLSCADVVSWPGFLAAAVRRWSQLANEAFVAAEDGLFMAVAGRGR